MTGKSFEGSAGEVRSETSSFVSNNNQMGWIPEDDPSPVFGGVASPQTMGANGPNDCILLPPTGREKHLAVIREDLDSQQEKASLGDERSPSSDIPNNK